MADAKLYGVVSNIFIVGLGKNPSCLKTFVKYKYFIILSSLLYKIKFLNSQIYMFDKLRKFTCY